MSRERTPQWLVERIALGELPPGKLEEARARLLAEPEGAERLARVESSSREILQALPPEQVVAEVTHRARGAQRIEAARRATRMPVVSRWALPVAALAAAALVLVLRPATLPVEDAGGDERLKGGEGALVIHRRGPDGSTRQIAKGGSARPGDTLQVSYVAGAEQRYGVVLSIDGAGSVTLHLPGEGSATAATLRQQGVATLPSSFELDTAPGFERFFLITSPQPFDVEVARSAASALAADPARASHAPLELPAGLQQTSFLVLKEFVQ